MLDYLSQLARRVQQSELAVQPRPRSRFESQRHAIPTALDSSAQEEANERGSQSVMFIPAESNADRRTQPDESRIRKESDPLDSFSEVQSTKKYQNPYPRQSITAPAIVPPVSSPETADAPVLEVAYLTEQRERIIQGAVAPAQPSVRIDKQASAAIVPSASSTETADLSVIEGAHPAPHRQQAEQRERIVRSAVAQAQSPISIDRLEQQTSQASPDPSGRRERSESTESIARREGDGRLPLVRIENPKGEERPSSPSTRTVNHRERGMFSELTDTEPVFGRKAEITAKSGLAPVPRREYTQPLGDRTAPQFGMAHATDAPTIQVTIGRVEIRATVAPASIRKTSTHRPAMSLDEYLKQRNGSRG